jgi:hypothetical protein
MTEIQQPFETHYHSASATLSRLDRLYVASPPWLVLQLGLRGKLLHDPFQSHQQSLSDHVPVAFCFTYKYQLPAEQRPIPRFVSDHPRFMEALDNLTAAFDLDALSVPLRLPMYKKLMREAARITRNELFAIPDDTMDKRSTVCGSIARAVWHNDEKLASILISKSPAAQEHLEIGTSGVKIRDPTKFSNFYDTVRSAALESRLRGAQRQGHRKNHASRRQWRDCG